MTACSPTEKVRKGRNSEMRPVIGAYSDLRQYNSGDQVQTVRGLRRDEI